MVCACVCTHTHTLWILTTVGRGVIYNTCMSLCVIIFTQRKGRGVQEGGGEGVSEEGEDGSWSQE